jgi:hypothetical protein
MIAVMDAGPLIAAWNKGDEHETWAQGIFKKYRGPYHTTELVLAEVAYMTGRDELIAQMVRERKFLIGASLWQNSAEMERCLQRFNHCDIADASVIVTSEMNPSLKVITTDKRHFLTYRRADGSTLPLELP